MDSNEKKCKCDCHIKKECKEMSVQTEFAPEYSIQLTHCQGNKNQQGYFSLNNYDYDSLYENAKEIANLKKTITLYKTKCFGITYFKYGNLIYFYKPFQRLFKPRYNEPFDMEEFITKNPPPFEKGGMCIFLLLFIVTCIFLCVLTFISLYVSFNIYLRIIQCIIFPTLVILLLYTFIRNPGAVFLSDSIQQLTKENVHDYKLCLYCQLVVLKHKKIVHCNHCGVCLEERDHHCDVFGKCIAKRNKWLFYGTIGTAMSTIVCIYVFVVLFLIRLFSR